MEFDVSDGEYEGDDILNAWDLVLRRVIDTTLRRRRAMPPPIKPK